MSSDSKAIVRAVERMREEVEREVYDRLPRRLGVLAVQHFKQNFRDSGFHDGGLRAWPKSKRELMGGKSASARYKTLTSARNHLMNSTESILGRGQVAIVNDVPYARIHNDGGTIRQNVPITREMRKFAWAMFFKTAGIRRTKGKKRRRRIAPDSLPREAEKWKALALTRKTMIKRSLRMPQRQFMGEGRELRAMIEREINQSLETIQKHGIPTK